MPARLAIVGCGAIGGHLARTLATWPTVERLLLVDRVAERAEALAGEVAEVAEDAKAAATEEDGPRPLSAEAVDLEAAVEGADVVVEAASQEAVAEVGPAALSLGRTLVVLSVGALADAALAEELEALAVEHGGRVLVPSGALGALDAVAAAREAGLDRVKLTTTKPPAGLGLDPAEVPGARTVFKGSAREAVRRWPANVNVAAALALAGLGFEATEVEIVADPAVDRNRHEVEAEGAFGTLSFRVDNAAFPENPATSYLAALSAVALLRRLDAPVRSGT